MGYIKADQLGTDSSTLWTLPVLKYPSLLDPECQTLSVASPLFSRVLASLTEPEPQSQHHTEPWAASVRTWSLGCPDISWLQLSPQPAEC